MYLFPRWSQRAPSAAGGIEVEGQGHRPTINQRDLQIQVVAAQERGKAISDDYPARADPSRFWASGVSTGRESHCAVGLQIHIVTAV